MHHKPFDGQAPPRPDGGTYSTPPDTLAGLRRWASQKGERRREGERR